MTTARSTLAIRSMLNTPQQQITSKSLRRAILRQFSQILLNTMKTLEYCILKYKVGIGLITGLAIIQTDPM
jgi:hypothetical protein